MNDFVVHGVDSLSGLAGASALVVAGAILILRSLRSARDRLDVRIALTRADFQANAAAAVQPNTMAKVGYGFSFRGLSPESREIVRCLAPFGIGPKMALAIYRVGRPIVTLCIGAAALFLALRLIPPPASARVALLAAGAAAVVAWILPSMLLGRWVKSRSAEAAAGLPDALELLVVCVEAGLSLDDGIDRVVQELRHSQPVLAEELALTAADWKILPSREQALKNLAERVNVPSVHSLVTTLSQTLRYGTPLGQALRNVAAELRDDSLLRIEERASQLPVMLTIPMMLFIMPTIFLIVAGPAALRIFDLFVSGRMF
jgi:tight adherence protein C